MKYLEVIRKINRFFVQNIPGSHYILPLFNKIFLPSIREKTEVETIYGFTIDVNAHEDRAIEQSIYERGVYEHGTMSIIDKFLRKGDTFMDVGANIGLMTLLAAKKVEKSGKVYAFEANPVILKELKANIIKNNFQSVYVEFCALGAFNGEGTLSENKFNENRGASTMLENSDSDGKRYKVPVKMLDKLPIEKCDLIKIDVEGWEMEVLNGGRQFFSTQDAPAIIIECSKDRVNDKDDRIEIYNTLKELNNYRIFKLEKNKERRGKLIEINSEDFLPEHDNLFCFLNKHLSKRTKVNSSIF